MSSSVSVPSGVSDYRNESGSENVNKSTTMVPGEVVIREVAMLCNLGLGHINPSLQFHTCLCAHGYTSTLFAPVNRVQRDEMTKRAKTIIKLERLVEYCQRLMPCPDEVPQALEAKSVMEGEPEANGALGDKVEEILALEMGPGLTLVLIEVKAAVIEELIDIYSDLHWQYNLWYKIVVEYYEGVHSNRGKVRPIAVFGDFMTVADVPVAEFFEAQCWTFCPSPCIVIGAFDNFFLSVAKAEEMKQVELPGLGSYKPDQLIRLKGIPALEKCTKLMLQLYHQRGAKKGFVCNDVDAFYRPELLSNIKQSITGLLNVGPVIGYDARIGRGLVDGDSDLEWLNQFADESVLFIAFGTVFSPSAEDMKAICTAIDKTPNYVLWSVRSPHKGVEGFSERGFPTSFEGKRARIVNWVNQPLVLQHRALGAFMSHCGWNSTIEACTLSGKPVICCPMGAEQFVNSLLLTTQMKNAVAVRGIDQEVLDSQDIVSKVNEAMTSSDLKTRAQEIKGLCNDCAKNTNEGAWKVLFDSLATTSS